MARIRLKKVLCLYLPSCLVFYFISSIFTQRWKDRVYQPNLQLNGHLVLPRADVHEIPGAPARKDQQLIPSTREEYCESRSLGCAQLFKKAQPSSAKDANACISHCNSKKFRFAGFHSSGTCTCAKAASTLGNLRTLIDRKDEPAWCRRNDVINIYFISGFCIRVFPGAEEHQTGPFSPSYVHSRSKGCFKFPTDEAKFRQVNVTSQARCLLECERERHPLAAYSNRGQCLCGRMSESFNLTHRVDTCKSSNIVEVFRTLVEDQRCGNIRLLPPGEYNRTSLNSTPGSGNTWTRYLLEKATGHYTGSMYVDGTLTVSGYLGEAFKIKDRMTDMVKDHIFDSQGVQLQAAITIVRNPYRALISQRNWESGKHHGLTSEDRLSTAFPPVYVEHNLKYWQSLITKTLNSGKPYLIMYYEDIVADPISSVKKMVEFLPNPALHPSDLEDRLACLSQETTGLAKRKSRKLSFNPWPAKSIEIVNRFVLETRQILLNAGVKDILPSYELDPDYATWDND